MPDVGDGQGSLLVDAETKPTVADTKAEDTKEIPEDPRGERRRTWSVEVLLKSGRSERETVRAVSRDATFRYVSMDGQFGQDMVLIVEGERALLRIVQSEIAMIRVC